MFASELVGGFISCGEFKRAEESPATVTGGEGWADLSTYFLSEGDGIPVVVGTVKGLMIEGAGVTDGSITHVLPYLLLQPSGGGDWEGCRWERDSFPFSLQCWIRPFLRIGARRIGVEKFGVLVVAYLVGWRNTLLDGIRLEVSSW